MRKRTISGFLSVLGGKIGASLLSVIITPLLVRLLGSNKYGDYAFLLSFFAIGLIISRAGISAGIRKYIAEDRPDPNWETNIFVFYSRLGLSLAVVGGSCLVIVGYVGPFSMMFGDRSLAYVYLLSFMLVTNQLFYILRYTLMGLSIEQYSESLVVLKQFLFGLFSIFLAYIGYGVSGVLFGTAVATLITSVLAILLLRHHIDLATIFRPLPNDFPSMDILSFNALNTIFVLLTFSLYHVDILLLRPLAGSQETGLYKSSLIIAEFLWLVPQAVQIVFIHTSSDLWYRGESEQITSISSKTTRYTMLFTLLMAIGIASLASDFVSLYFGSEFSGAVIPLLILLPGALGFAIARPIYAIGQGKGRLRVLILATGFAAVLNLLLNIILIPQFGMVGAAFATSVGYCSMLISHGYIAHRIGFYPFSDLRIARVTITAVPSAIAIFALSYLVESAILSMLLIPPMGFLLYMGIALRARAISPDEITLAIRELPHPLSTLAEGFVSYAK